MLTSPILPRTFAAPRSPIMPWPAGAVYQVSFERSRWPGGYVDGVEYFANAFELQDWYQKMCEWAVTPFHEVHIAHLYMWANGGPQEIDNGDWDAHFKRSALWHILPGDRQ